MPSRKILAEFEILSCDNYFFARFGSGAMVAAWHKTTGKTPKVTSIYTFRRGFDKNKTHAIGLQELFLWRALRQDGFYFLP